MIQRSIFLSLFKCVMLSSLILLSLCLCSCRCDGDVDECEQEGCGNAGECVNTLGSFYCNCSEGFEGQFCDDQAPGDDTQVEYEQRWLYSIQLHFRISSSVAGGVRHSQLQWTLWGVKSNRLPGRCRVSNVWWRDVNSSIRRERRGDRCSVCPKTRR